MLLKRPATLSRDGCRQSRFPTVAVRHGGNASREKDSPCGNEYHLTEGVQEFGFVGTIERTVH
jgi:hypothetical protein